MATRSDLTPQQQAQRERWAEKDRAERERRLQIRQQHEQRRAAFQARQREDVRLGPYRRRFAELLEEECRLVALVEAPLDLFTDYRARAVAEAELAWLRRVMETCPDEVKPAPGPSPEVLQAQRAEQRATLQVEIRELEEQLRQSEEASRRPSPGPPVDSRSGPALDLWRRNQVIREEEAERGRSMLRAELHRKRQALSGLGDE